MDFWLIVGLAAGLTVLSLVLWFRRLETFRKLLFIKDTLRAVFYWLEDRGLIEPSPGLLRDYHSRYPGVAILEKNYDVVRAECEALLEMKERIIDIGDLGGSFTDGGIHTVQWKSFMFKSGEFLEDNCLLCPQTTALLRQIPDLYTAFFSILEPHQYIKPHWGYYRGFVRYHLGVIIPNDNEDGSCWLRVNADREDNEVHDEALVVRGARYYWKNGEGIVFDDTYLHDAENGSDEIRVVLWLDLAKHLPFYVQVWNRLLLWLAHKDSSVRSIRENARIRDPLDIVGGGGLSA